MFIKNLLPVTLVLSEFSFIDTEELLGISGQSLKKNKLKKNKLEKNKMEKNKMKKTK